MSEAPNAASKKFYSILETIKKQDGILWLRILGQTHWQFNEMPFWVLLRDRTQIRGAILYLQKELRPLQGLDMADITISFITYENNEDCSHGFIKGDDFFASNVFDQIYDKPACSPREMGLFDREHPNDAWAIKEGR